MFDRGDVRRLIASALMASATMASAGCRSPSGPAAPAPATGGAAALPICGVLIEHASPDDADHTAFLVPAAPDGPRVRRYDVVNRTRGPMPLSVYAGWWVCVTDGRIIAEPGADYWEMGTIEIGDVTIDQFNAERGQE